MIPRITIPVEICINCTDSDSTFAAVSAARKGGAQRVELCSRMDVDGLTPFPALVMAACRAWGPGPGLLAMIRPRPGDFVFSDGECDLMADQIRQMAQAGADGVVLGAVIDEKLDRRRLARLVDVAQTLGLRVTCHRAFDAASDPEAALSTVTELDMHRVLTSGTPWGSGLGVEEGVKQLIQLRRQAKPWLEIVLGGGVDAATIGPVLAQMPLDAGPVSIHAYSSVLRNEVTEEGAVADLVAVARRTAQGWMEINQ